MSVNSNFCNNYNLWLLPWPKESVSTYIILIYPIISSSQDPAGQLAWMVEELTMAERAGSLVYIISHIPPGLHSCLAAWSHQVTLMLTFNIKEHDST